jgi:regulator of replication initiation timing
MSIFKSELIKKYPLKSDDLVDPIKKYSDLLFFIENETAPLLAKIEKLKAENKRLKLENKKLKNQIEDFKDEIDDLKGDLAEWASWD